jgi:hypothetical protein
MRMDFLVDPRPLGSLLAGIPHYLGVSEGADPLQFSPKPTCQFLVAIWSQIAPSNTVLTLYAGHKLL